MYEGKNQVDAQKQDDCSKNQHKKRSLLLFRVKLFAAPSDQQGNQPHTSPQNPQHQQIQHCCFLLLFSWYHGWPRL